MKRKSFFSTLPSVPYLVWMAVFIIVPLILIAVFAFTTTVKVDENGTVYTSEEIAAIEEECEETGEEPPTFTEEKIFTVDNILEVNKYMPVILKSVLLSIIATAICLVIGYPLAYFISRAGFVTQKFMIMLVMLPMWMNFLLRTYAWMTLLENNGIINRALSLIGLGPFEMINTSGAVVLGMVYNYLPFMILPLYSVMTKISDQTVNAARDLGAGGRSVFSKIILPLSMPGVASGITMVFVPAISTFIISKMLGGGTNQLIGDIIDMQFLGSAYNPHLGAAMSLVLLVFILLCMSLTNQLDNEETEGTLL